MALIPILLSFFVFSPSSFASAKDNYLTQIYELRERQFDNAQMLSMGRPSGHSLLFLKPDPFPGNSIVSSNLLTKLSSWYIGEQIKNGIFASGNIEEIQRAYDIGFEKFNDGRSFFLALIEETKEQFSARHQVDDLPIKALLRISYRTNEKPLLPTIMRLKDHIDMSQFVPQEIEMQKVPSLQLVDFFLGIDGEGPQNDPLAKIAPQFRPVGDQIEMKAMAVDSTTMIDALPLLMLSAEMLGLTRPYKNMKHGYWKVFARGETHNELHLPLNGESIVNRPFWKERYDLEPDRQITTGSILIKYNVNPANRRSKRLGKIFEDEFGFEVRQTIEDPLFANSTAHLAQLNYSDWVHKLYEFIDRKIMRRTPIGKLLLNHFLLGGSWNKQPNQFEIDSRLNSGLIGTLIRQTSNCSGKGSVLRVERGLNN